MLVQIPIFIVLFNVIRGLTRTTTSVGLQLGQFSADAFLADSVRGVNNTPRTFNPAYLDQDSSLYRDLTDTTEMTSWGIDLARSASQQLGEGIVDALPYLLMIAVVAVTGFVQQRQIMGRNPNAMSNPQQQMIMKIMPVFLPVISFGMPAALVVYFLVSNLYRIGQQAYITRSLYGDKAEAPDVVVPDLDDEPKKSKKTASSKGGSGPSSSKNGAKGSTPSSSSSSSEAKRRRTTAGSKPPKRSTAPKKSSSGGGSAGGASASGSSGGTTSRRVSQPGQPQHRSKKKKKR
jgi:YidC/Oxa1 family membrane protein insertase